MAYQRKTRDVWRFYVNYGNGYELECTDYSRKEAMDDKKAYAENCPQYPTKIVKGREKLCLN